MQTSKKRGGRITVREARKLMGWTETEHSRFVRIVEETICSHGFQDAFRNAVTGVAYADLKSKCLKATLLRASKEGLEKAGTSSTLETICDSYIMKRKHNIARKVRGKNTLAEVVQDVASHEEVGSKRKVGECVEEDGIEEEERGQTKRRRDTQEGPTEVATTGSGESFEKLIECLDLVKRKQPQLFVPARDLVDDASEHDGRLDSTDCTDEQCTIDSIFDSAASLQSSQTGVSSRDNSLAQYDANLDRMGLMGELLEGLLALSDESLAHFNSVCASIRFDRMVPSQAVLGQVRDACSSIGGAGGCLT